MALLLLVIPALVLVLMTPGLRAEPNAPESVLLVVLNLVNLVLGLIAIVAITHLSMRPGASVGEALKAGGRRFVPLLLATLLLTAAILVVIVPLLLLLAPDAVLNGGTARVPAGVSLIFLVLMLAILALWVRLLVMTPIATAEPLGPIGIIRRSWELTAGHYWRLLGAALLILIVFVIVAIAITLIAGVLLRILVGPISPGTTAGTALASLSVLLQTLGTVVMAVWVSRLYLQLRGSNPTDAFA